MIRIIKKSFLGISVLTLTACVSVDSKPIRENNIQDNEIEIFFTPGVECENNIIKRSCESYYQE